MADWLDPQPIPVPGELRQAVGGHPLVAETLARRGIVTPEAARAFLDPALYRPAPPSDLPGMAEALERLTLAVERHERVLVWGDFDVDGLAATATLVEALRALDLPVTYHVPGRGEGHGVYLGRLQGLLAGAERPQLVLTCDTGISATAAVAYARGLGVDFVITDHHALPPDLPAARAIVNPCFLADAHPLRTLPGAGCAYLLASALLDRLGRDGGEQALDLLGLAIVADVAALQGDVRYYLQRALAALRDSRRSGLVALCEIAGLERAGLDEEHLGFALGPRLNALGRLSDARAGVELFLSDDLTRARTIAAEMEGLNNQRRLLTSQVTQAAREQVERDPAAGDAPVLVVAHPTWPGGIVGLVAGRLAERYGKPAVVLATPPGEMARGSARSVAGIDIAAAIAAVGDLLISHGGHPMAAGLSLRPEQLSELKYRLQAEVGRRAASAPPPPSLAIDGYLELEALSPGLARDLGRLAPFGPGNPPIVLAARRLRAVAQAALGRTGEHRRLHLRDEAGHEQKVFWWQAEDRPAPEGVFDLAFTLRTSNYQGRDEVTVQWLAARVVEAPAPVLVAPKATFAVTDHRDDLAPALALEALRALGPLLVWAEGGTPPCPGAVDRLGVQPAEALAIWTAPPGPRELAALVERAQPRRVHLFAVDPKLDEPGSFLRRLSGLLKYALSHYGGRVDEALIERLAAASAQRAATVRCGLRWLVAQGQIVSQGEAGDVWQLAPGPGPADPAAARELAGQLDDLLRETAAYRAYARRADAHVLLAFEA